MSETITRQDLAETLHRKLGFNKTEALYLVNEMFELITKELEQGNNVKLSNFGSFILRHKSARIGQNISKGKAMMIPARKVVVFRSSAKLKIDI